MHGFGALLGGIVWVFEGPKLALPKPGIMVYFRAKYPQMAEFRLKYDFIDPDDMQIIVSLWSIDDSYIITDNS